MSCDKSGLSWKRRWTPSQKHWIKTTDLQLHSERPFSSKGLTTGSKEQTAHSLIHMAPTLLATAYFHILFLRRDGVKGDFRLRLLWGACRNLRDPGPNLVLTEGVHHIPKEILSLDLISVENKAQAGEVMRKAKASKFWSGENSTLSSILISQKAVEDLTLYFFLGYFLPDILLIFIFVTLAIIAVFVYGKWILKLRNRNYWAGRKILYVEVEIML